MPYKLGKKAARPGAVKFKFNNYFDKRLLPIPPPVFGHYKSVRNGWGMLANDEFGDCVWAGAAHESILWNATVGNKVHYLSANVLSDYSAVTGFNPSDPNSDAGTDMQMAASYRRLTGIVDATGARHKIDSYVALSVGSVSDVMTATYLFGATGIGIMFPDYAMAQFDHGQKWDFIAGQPDPQDGHYVPIVGRNSNGDLLCVTWGKLHAMTERFFKAYNDEGIAYVSLEPLKSVLISPEGFNVTELQKDLKALG